MDEPKALIFATGAAARSHLRVPIAWWVALGTTLGVCFGFSTFVATIFGQFVRPLSADFGWTRTQTTGALSLATFLTVAGAPIAGLFIDQIGPHRVLLVASVLLPLFVACLALNDGSLLGYYITMALIAVVGAGTLPGTYTAIILKWFDHRRGLALGFPLAGVGLGGILLPPAIRSLITASNWQTAIISISFAMFVIVVPLALFLFRLEPLNDQEIDGGIAHSAETYVATDFHGDGWKKSLITRQYLQLACAFILLGIVTLGVLINFQAMLEDDGIQALTAAKILSLEGFFMLVFRIAAGWFLDRFPPRLVASLMILSPAVGIAIIAANPTLPMLLISVPLLAIGFGGEFDVMSYFASRYFGRAYYGKLYGLIYASYTLGATLGPPFLAQVYDRTGGYRYGLVSLALLAVIASALVMTLPRLPIGSDTSRSCIRLVGLPVK